MRGKPYNLVSYDPEVEARLLFNRGYRQVSLFLGAVSRVDVSDLMKALKEKLPHSSVGKWDIRTQEDHWRRCYSQDTINGVPKPIMAVLRRLWDTETPDPNVIPVVTCRDNNGMEDAFDRGVDYMVSPCEERGFISVYDKFGKLRLCSRNRFSRVFVGA
jgi:hypothetical protein